MDNFTVGTTVTRIPREIKDSPAIHYGRRLLYRLLMIITAFLAASGGKAAVPSASSPPGDSRQDTILLSMHDAEERFRTSNLQLFGAKLGVQAARALIHQAGLWNNPNIAFEQNIYNQETGRYFDVTSSGNTGVQIQQLIVLAGKRDKQVRLAAGAADIAEQGYSDLLRTLRLELRTDFFDLYYVRQSIAFYEESIPGVRRTVEAAESMYGNRSLLLSELLRLKSLLLNLESDELELRNQEISLRSDLRLLMHDTSETSVIIPVVHDDGSDSTAAEGLDPLQLDTVALANRPDYRSALEVVRNDETNLDLQNALKIPDITIGGLWSRQGSYIPNYYALTLSVDLPVFNRNQGNIEAAEATLEADRIQQEQLRQKIIRDVSIALDRVRQAEQFYRRADPGFPSQYRTLVEGMLLSYRQRNINIIAFTDFYESYRTSMMQLNKIRSMKADARESLNYTVGSIILNKEY